MKEALKLALEALEWFTAAEQGDEPPINKAITAIKEALAQTEQEQKCWCTTCRPITMSDMRFVVCPDCGNKRCPKANDHCNACTESNEVGQKGSSWEHVKPLAQPEQEPVDLEIMASAVHDAYLNTCDALGWGVKPENRVPYSELTENSKELDRASVRAVLRLVVTTTQPKRPWVGLTDDEYDEIWRMDLNNKDIMDKTIAKLKEKNT